MLLLGARHRRNWFGLVTRSAELLSGAPPSLCPTFKLLHLAASAPAFGFPRPRSQTRKRFPRVVRFRGAFAQPVGQIIFRLPPKKKNNKNVFCTCVEKKTSLKHWERKGYQEDYYIMHLFISITRFILHSGSRGYRIMNSRIMRKKHVGNNII